MKTLFSAFLAMIAFTTLLSTSTLAGRGGDPVDCARQLRNCLRQCNQLEADAKAAKVACERKAYSSFRSGSPELKKALEACRYEYNVAMNAVAKCRDNCKWEYQNCLGGGEGQPE